MKELQQQWLKTKYKYNFIDGEEGNFDRFFFVFVICGYLLTIKLYFWNRGRCGRDRMVVRFTTTCTISACHHLSCEFESCSGEVYSIQHNMIKFVSELQHVSGFLRVLRFPPPILWVRILLRRGVFNTT
jgi:hypothetical protein